MRRNSRRGVEKQNWWENKKVLTSGIAIVAVFAAAVSISLYSNQSNSDSEKDKTNSNQIISLVSDDENQTNTQSESASSSIGRSIEEEEADNNTANTSNTTNTTSEETTNTTTKSNSSNTTKSSSNTSSNTTSTSTQVVEETEEITFSWPVEGELLKAFSVDNLLYSSTLDEWVTHNGIDIKADKTSVVKASADGTVKSIKNDPRYGLTVVIDHADNYRTVYSNLLTAEFVVEGETITQGQTIGTVGNTATFEIADESHLHFELLKDSEYVDPTIYLK